MMTALPKSNPSPAIPSLPNASLLQVLRWNIADAWVIASRNLIQYRRVPQLLVFSTIQPIMFVLLFTYVFGGAIASSSSDYIRYFLPGILVQTVMFGGTGTSVGLATDLKKGLIDRFRSLPMARSAVLAGRTGADSVRNFFVILLMIGVGHVVGFRFGGNLPDVLAGIALLVLFGHVMSWIFATIGIVTKDPETAQVSGFVWAFPLAFASSIFAPTNTMPSGLRTFAENQPLTLVANSVRALFAGQTDILAGDVPVDFWRALLWMVAIFLVFAPLAITLYRRNAD
jgi:ABC-2 type transport system permease protein/oleandomycin transport system permease protein